VSGVADFNLETPKITNNKTQITNKLQ